jgi:hypothetical protein
LCKEHYDTKAVLLLVSEVDVKWAKMTAQEENDDKEFTELGMSSSIKEKKNLMNQIIFINIPQSTSGKQTRFADLFASAHSFHIQLAVCKAAQSCTSVLYPQV